MTVVTMQGPSTTQQIVSHYLDQFNENQRAQQSNAIAQQQLAQQASAQKDTASFQQGTLQDARDKLAQVQKVYNDARLQKKEQDFTAQISPIQDTIDSLSQKNPNDPQIAALQAQAQSLTQAALADEPGLDNYIKTAAIAKVLSPQRQEQLATQATKTGAAQAMQSGTPTPMQAEVFHAGNFGNTPVPAALTKDIQAQQPAATEPPKGQQPSAYTDYLRGPALGLDTTAEQDQASQTQKDVAGMQGQAMRDVAGIQGATQTNIEKMKVAALTAPPGTVSDMVTQLANRQASLDDLAKKGSPLREKLINSMPPGVIAPSNEKERSDLVGADSTASLMLDRIQKIRDLSPVVNSGTNRMEIAALVNAGDSTFGQWMAGAVRNEVDPKVLDYVQELRNLREDQMSLRKYLGNPPMRSDKQVNLMLNQSVGTDAGNAADVNRMLDVFEPAVRKLIVANQSAGKPSNLPGQQPSGVTHNYVQGQGIVPVSPGG